MSDADRDVVRDIRRGYPDAFAQLVDRYQQRLFGLMLMMVRERGAAEDVTQDAFVRAYTHLDAYDDQRPFYPWLATIGVRLAQTRLRSQGRALVREGARLEEHAEPASPEITLEALIADERARALWGAVARLPPGERAAVILYYRDELSVADIARALGVTTGTIKTLLFRGRRHLRERLPYDTPRDGERSR